MKSKQSGQAQSDYSSRGPASDDADCSVLFRQAVGFRYAQHANGGVHLARRDHRSQHKRETACSLVQRSRARAWRRRRHHPGRPRPLVRKAPARSLGVARFTTASHLKVTSTRTHTVLPRWKKSLRQNKRRKGTIASFHRSKLPPCCVSGILYDRCAQERSRRTVWGLRPALHHERAT